MTRLTMTVAGEELVASAAKTLYWPRAGTLFVADPHWGKAASFRAVGVAVPTGSLAADLDRLGRELAATAARRLVVLGDLFHDRNSLSLEVFETVLAWRARHAELAIELVRGNHDLRAGDPPSEWGFAAHAGPLMEPPFALLHRPEPVAGAYTLAGHLHPGVTLFGTGRQRLRLPCFHFAGSVGTLPAFGGFTGTAEVTRRPGDQTVVVADGEVVPLT